MGEYGSMSKKLAVETLKHVFQQDTAPGADPVLELISCLLEDEAGGVTAPPGYPITTEQWLAWNRLTLERPQQLSQVVAEVQEREWLEVPTDQALLRPWAACLLLCTLERLEMK